MLQCSGRRSSRYSVSGPETLQKLGRDLFSIRLYSWCKCHLSAGFVFPSRIRLQSSMCNANPHDFRGLRGLH